MSNKIDVLIQGATKSTPFETTSIPTKVGQTITARSAQYGGWQQYTVVKIDQSGENPVYTLKMSLVQ